MALPTHDKARAYGRVAAMAAICLLLFAFGCAGDNVHKPDPGAVPEDVKAEGSLTSSIPVFPTFEPIVTDNTVEIVWTNASATKATIKLSGFKLHVNEMNLDIEIGEMAIEAVVFGYGEDGVARFEKSAFECQAGAYFTTGSLAGTYYPKSGAIDLTIDYKPGSMPFMVKSQFISK